MNYSVHEADGIDSAKWNALAWFAHEQDAKFFMERILIPRNINCRVLKESTKEVICEYKSI